jgi:hypothetical protein
MAVCDLLIRLALRRTYRARWSRDILNETVKSVAKRKPDIPVEKIAHRVERMSAAILDAEITGYEALTATFEADFGTDAHVVAAAVVGRVDVIVTENLKDFPADLLKPLGLEAQSVDVFLVHQVGLKSELVEQTVREQAEALKKPPVSFDELLKTLERTAPKFGAELRALNEYPKD